MARALDDADAEPEAGDEALLTERARDWWKASMGSEQEKTPTSGGTAGRRP